MQPNNTPILKHGSSTSLPPPLPAKLTLPQCNELMNKVLRYYSLQDEADYLNNVFSKNNYNTDFVRRNTHSNTDSNTQTNVNSGPVTTATLPYIRGNSETIARILQPYNIRVAHKPITTFRRLLTNFKDKANPEDIQEAVYKIKCCDCQASCIGEIGRNLSTRLTEHKRATRNGDVNNHIAEHHLQTKH